MKNYVENCFLVCVEKERSG